MSVTLFTATGCTRCKIVKKFMYERHMTFDEKDIKAEGKRDFQTFYREHQQSVVRGPDGIELPIYFFKGRIRQGLGPVLAYLKSGDALDGFVQPGFLHGQWVDGLDVSRGDQEHFEDLLSVLTFMKRNGMKLEVKTDGRNPDLLKRLIAEGMVDRGIMEVKGPKDLYSRILNREIDLHHIEETMILIAGIAEYRFQTTNTPVLRSDEKWSYLTPDEIGETAAWLAQATGNNKHPYFIRRPAQTDAKDENLPGVQSPAPENLFGFRSKARRQQVRTEIEKTSQGDFT